ncbi:MAG: hypothetical protein ACFFFH_10530, partial [Candidatus Thorarchaeota archaeon]
MSIDDSQSEFFSSKWFLYRLRGWHLWYIQNLFLLIISILLVPNIILTILFALIGVFLGNILNMIFSISMVLDLIAITIISISFIIESKINGKTKELLIGISGFLWLLCSLIWRVPYFLSDRLGLALALTTEKVTFLNLNDSLFVFPIILGSFSLISFLLLLRSLLSDKYHHLKSKILLFGISNCIGTFFLFIIHVLFLDAPGYWFRADIFVVTIITMLSKLFFTPYYGMKVSRYSIAITDHKCSYPSVKHLGGKPRELFKTCVGCEMESLITAARCNYCGRLFPSHQIQIVKESIPKRVSKKETFKYRNIDLMPSRRIMKFVIVGMITLILFPISPFFIDNILPSHNIDGPFIYKECSTVEAENVLHHIENLDLSEITGYGNRDHQGPHLMDGITLNYFLVQIAKARNKIQGPPITIRFTWNITVLEVLDPEFNVDVFTDYWAYTKEIEKGTNYLTWWEYGDQHVDYLWDFRNSLFSNFSMTIKWVCYSYYNYYYNQVLLGSEEETSQLLFLNANLDLVCLAHKYECSNG